MAWKVFAGVLSGCDWTAFVDNQSIIGVVTRGSASHTGEDITYLVGNFWTEIAQRQVDLHMIYVHSPSNPADGPTRNDWSLVHSLGMRIYPADFPVWCHDLWNHVKPF